MRLCAQEVKVLPETPTATYLEDFTYLVTSRDDEYRLLNYSRGAKESGKPIAGCQSCLLRSSCDGRIETPDGALVLVPDPRTCQFNTGMIINIKQHPLIQTLEEAERNLPGVVIPAILREQARSEMFEALRLNLIQLPEVSVEEDVLAENAKHFADEILRKYTPFHRQMLRSRPVRYGFVIWVLVTTLAIFGYVYWRCLSKNSQYAHVLYSGRRDEAPERSNCCGLMMCESRQVLPPKYDPPYDRGAPRPIATPRASRVWIRSVDRSIYQPDSQRAHRLTRRTLRELPERAIRQARL